jgi:peptidyl-prolyl cis-trans isomerase C
MRFIQAAKAIAPILLFLGVAHAEDNPGAAAGSTANVAVVNGIPIPQARMDFIVKSQIQQGQKDSPELRQNIKDVLVTREVLAQEAAKKGLDQSPEVKTQLDMAKQEFLIRAYFEDFIKANPITDEQARAEYDKIKAAQSDGGAKLEYKARHILVKTEKDAKAILASLAKTKGKNFEQLAKQKSDDSGSKAQGGALDWSDGSNYVKEFTDALTKLQKGEYTKTPVKTRFGYHIIMLDDTREMQFPPFEQVKEKIQQQLLTQLRDKKIEELRAAAKVE